MPASAPFPPPPHGAAALAEAVARGGPVLTDGGIETYVAYETDVELPELETLAMVGDARGHEVLADLYGRYLDVARRHGLPAVVGTPTWRGGPARLAAAGHPPGDVARLNAEGVAFQRDLVEGRLRAAADRGETWSAWVAGAMAPRGDGYDPAGAPSVDEAARYHRPQAEALAGAGVDLLFGVPLPTADEAVGMGRAMAATGVAWVPSFLVDAAGLLPDGTPLVVAVGRVHDEVPTPPAHVSISCVHPTTVLAAFRTTVDRPGGRAAWAAVRELKANGSALPPGELDAAHRLVCDRPPEWADAVVEVRDAVGLAVVGGCCGTDPHHLDALAARLQAAEALGSATAGR